MQIALPKSSSLLVTGLENVFFFYLQNVKEVAEDVKEVVIEKVDEVSNDLKDAAKDLLKSDESPKTPTAEGDDKKKVKKSFSLRKKLSFLRREKKVKEDKHKNGDVATPEVSSLYKTFC